MLLNVDVEEETISLIGTDGQTLGCTTWNSVIQHIMSAGQAPVPIPARRHPRVPVSISVRYRTAEGTVVESRTSGIGAGGLYIESVRPVSLGSFLMVEFALPDQPDDWVQALCRVAWICERPDQYDFHPGMGVQFEEIPEAVRARVIAFVTKQLEGPN
jgi:type IV pilus assembly protein PilZ